MCNEGYNNQALHSVLRSCKYKKMSLIVDHTREIQEQGIVLSSSVKLNSLAKRYSHSATHIDKPTNFNNSSNKLSLVGLVKEDSILLINLRNVTGSNQVVIFVQHLVIILFIDIRIISLTIYGQLYEHQVVICVQDLMIILCACIGICILHLTLCSGSYNCGEALKK